MADKSIHKDQNIDDTCDSRFFSQSVRDSIAEFTKVLNFKKGDVLIKEGEMVQLCYHVVEGCLRQYRIIDGEEKSIFFFTEGQSVLSFAQTNSICLSNFYVDCIEDTKTSVMSATDEKELYRRHPEVESLSRMSLESMIREYQDSFSNFMVLSPEERYLNLMETRPNLLTRVPQYHIASYLGVKPESLSRIRKRLANRKG